MGRVSEQRSSELRAIATSDFGMRRKRSRIAKEIESRDLETLAMYEPLPMQEAFHRCRAPERIYRGPNRMGKTTCGLMEVGWVATGTHPWLKYPKEKGIICLVAKDETHIGNIFYRLDAKNQG